jgi:hypothetical protein
VQKINIHILLSSLNSRIMGLIEVEIRVRLEMKTFAWLWNFLFSLFCGYLVGV